MVARCPLNPGMVHEARRSFVRFCNHNSSMLEQGRSIRCPKNINIVYADPRALIVSVRAPGVALNVCVLHAPTSGTSFQDFKTWVDDVTDVCVKIPALHELPLLMAVDANNRFGSVQSAVFGDHHPDHENKRGALLHELFHALQVFAPSPFPDTAQKDSEACVCWKIPKPWLSQVC